MNHYEVTHTTVRKHVLVSLTTIINVKMSVFVYLLQTVLRIVRCSEDYKGSTVGHQQRSSQKNKHNTQHYLLIRNLYH